MAYEKQNFVEDQILKATHLNNMEDGIAANAESISEIGTTMDTIDENVDDIESLVNTINTNVDSVKTDVASVKTDVGTVNTNVSNVKSSVDTINTNLTTVDSIVDTINSNVSSVKTTVGTINTNASTAATKATAAATDAASIKTTVNTINSNVSSIKSTLSSVNTNTSKNKSYVSSTGTTVLKKIISSEKTTTFEPEYIGFCRIVGFSGQLTIQASLKGADKLYSSDNLVNNAYIRIRFNGSDVNHGTVTGTTQEYATYSTNIYVTDGDVINFYIAGQRTGYGKYYCNLLTVCGTISEGSFTAKVV